MNKKIFGMPLWFWAVVVAGGGYLFYRIHKERSEEPTASGEGLYPTSGLEAPPPETAAAPAAGIAQLGEELQGLAAAGFVPKGSEEAKGEPAFAPPSKLEGLLEEGFGAYLEGLMNPSNEREHPARNNKGEKHKGKGKGQKAKGGKGKGKGGKGKHAKQPNTGHHPGHTQTPNHRASAHPNQRITRGQAHASSRAGTPKRPAAQQAAHHTGQQRGGAHPAKVHHSPPPKPPRRRR
jgi:hypothetical protein